jgi:rubrerythrin
VTTENRIAVQTEEGHLHLFSPYETENPLDGETMITIGLKIAFDSENDTVTFFSEGIEKTFNISKCGFTIAPYSSKNQYCNYSDCESCSMKGKC